MDRISNLPDEIICHILSFLTTNEAALTSILAKKWHNLFAFVPNLDIDYYAYPYPEEGKWHIEEIRLSFMDSIDRVLELQGDSPIKKFSLKCMNRADSNRVDAWISNVLVRDVSELHLSIYLNTDKMDNYRLSTKFLENKKLVKLEICGGIDIGWFNESFSLPMLKTLILESIYVDNFEFVLHALPALEELVLVGIIWKSLDVTLSSASLKTLTIDSNFVLTFSFDTPSLVYFCYSDFTAKDYSIAKMDNLVELWF